MDIDLVNQIVEQCAKLCDELVKIDLLNAEEELDTEMCLKYTAMALGAMHAARSIREMKL